MSERVIGIRYLDCYIGCPSYEPEMGKVDTGNPKPVYVPDPEAPRVDEIVKSLLKGREAMVRMMEEVICTSHQERELAQIDALIARLEDA